MITINRYLKHTLQFVFLLSMTIAMSQNGSAWHRLSKTEINITEISRTKKYQEIQQVYSINLENFKTMMLDNLRHWSGHTFVKIPNDKGELEQFRVEESELFHPGLQAKFPQIKIYTGHHIKNPSITIRFRVSPKGIKSMRLIPGEEITYVESLDKDISKCIVYKESFRSNIHDPVKCDVMDQINISELNSGVYEIKFFIRDAGAEKMVTSRLIKQ